MSNHVTIVEMGPRDGLQNETSIVSTTGKITLIDRLSKCGFSKIEATSFVSPKWVPQMADAADVMSGITRKPDVSYAVLTPNMRGFEAAVAARADEVAIFASASEGFSQKNINCSIAESFERFKPILQAASGKQIPIRGYVSCVIKCPYDGVIEPNAVTDVASALIEMGCYEVSLGDTIGAATPRTTEVMLNTVLKTIAPQKLAGHFHDTGGLAIENILVSLKHGLRVFDSSIGGLGGCPYAPGAKGNVATEELIKYLHKAGYDTGIDIEKLNSIAAFAKSLRRSA